MKTAKELIRAEYDWLACDGEGYVGLFSTAGAGYAPEAFLANTEDHDAAIEDILANPKTTEARFWPDIAADCTNTWRLVAERGIFAFDCDPNGGPYQLVAAPVSPVRVDALPGTSACVVRGIVFPHLRLSRLERVSPEMLKAR